MFLEKFFRKFKIQSISVSWNYDFVSPSSDIKSSFNDAEVISFPR